jgi:integrase
MTSSVNITKRLRKRELTSGAIVEQIRYVLNYREPSGRRRQLFFEKRKDAQTKRNQIVAEIETGTYSEDRVRSVTIREVVRRWLESREGEVKDGTLEGYRRAAANIVGPLLVGTTQQRTQFTLTGKQPEGTKTVPLMGDFKVHDLTTSDIRSWHKTLVNLVGWYSANRGKMFLVAILALAAEDLNIRPPAMPSNLGRGKTPKTSPFSTTGACE